MSEEFRYRPVPTGQRFMDSRAYIKIIMGPVGGGKSTVAFMDLVLRSLAQAPYRGIRRTKHGIMRNTSAQLRSTVKPLMEHWLGRMFPGCFEWRATDGLFDLKARLPDGTGVHSEFLLLAADTPDDVRRLLSLELSSGWVEESREIAEEVFSGFQGRVDRYPNMDSGGVTYPGLICSTNPPPLGTFWHKIITDPPANTEVFVQPPALTPEGALNPQAENLANLSPTYYENLVGGKTEAWIDVYLKNRFGPGEWGHPIYRNTFKREFHTAKQELIPVMQSVHPLVIGMDNGLTAAAAVMQADMRGRVNVLAEAHVPDGQTMGVEKFLDSILLPMLNERFPFKRENVIFELDPACFARTQVNEATIAQAVQRRGYQVHKAPTNDPERRISAVEDLLSRQIDGGPAILFDPRATWLIDAMDWGYRFKRRMGTATTPQIDKTAHSHVAEALQYGALRFATGVVGGGVFSPAHTARPLVRRPYAYT